MYPIICKIYYCPQCSYYLCHECKEKNIKHEHILFLIESKEDLRKIKDYENDEIERKNRIKENQMRQIPQQNEVNLINNYKPNIENNFNQDIQQNNYNENNKQYNSNLN